MTSFVSNIILCYSFITPSILLRSESEFPATFAPQKRTQAPQEPYFPPSSASKLSHGACGGRRPGAEALSLPYMPRETLK
eukprot:scaffold2114_cov253-Pinguiococcus_pyrenoidosus.AAC.1